MKHHRIYVYVGQKFMFLGLTLTEWALCLLGLTGLFLLDGALLKLLDILGVSLGMYLSRYFRKQHKGVSLPSFLYWHFNLKRQRVFLPASYKRQWWGR